MVCSAEDGEKIVKAAVDAFGTVHVLVNNAGILRDKSFQNMDEKMWDQVIAVHLRGSYKVRQSISRRVRLTNGISVPRQCGLSLPSRSMAVC